MEQTVTTGFLKSIQEITKRYTQEVEQESQQFAAAIHAIRNVAAPVAAPVPSSIEQRLSQLEQNYQRQLQKTVAGLSEDIGDLDSRLAAIEREQREESDPWASWPAGETLAESLHNVVVVNDTLPSIEPTNTSRNIVIHMDDDGDVSMIPLALDIKSVEIKPSVEVKPVEVKPVEVKPVEVKPVEVKPVEVKPVEVKPVEVVQVKSIDMEEEEEEEDEEEDEEEEEEEEGLELEEFTFNGKSYYKDTDNNVYRANDDGEVEETPIGRWIEKRQTIKLYN